MGKTLNYNVNFYETSKSRVAMNSTSQGTMGAKMYVACVDQDHCAPTFPNQHSNIFRLLVEVNDDIVSNFYL